MTDANATLLPPNATPPETALATVAARVSDVPVPIDRLWNPETCSAQLLPWLAWALSVDAWDTAWPEAVKRDVIRASFAVHERKGTVGAVKKAMAALGVDVDLVEWWQEAPAGQPHTFPLTAWANANLALDGEAVLNDRMYASLQRVVDATKPVRSHYTFQVGAKFDAGLTARAVAGGRQALRRTVTPPPHAVYVDGGRLGLTTGAAQIGIARRAMDAGTPDVTLGTARITAQAAGLATGVLRATMEPRA